MASQQKRKHEVVSKEEDEEKGEDDEVERPAAGADERGARMAICL